jgi:hypothetical protein
MTTTVDTWFIAHNGKDIYHYGFAAKGTSITSGQPILETFESEQEYLDKLKQYGINIEDETDMDDN